MKGIIIAGGLGTRLYPVTRIISKQFLPIYDKPMIYYPISVLMLANIRNILLISTPEYIPLFKKLLGDGSRFGIKFTYAIQSSPKGVAQAFLIGEEFIAGDKCALILGDNIFIGHNFNYKLKSIIAKNSNATIFVYRVLNPEHFGVVEVDKDFNALNIEEKPILPRSNLAITGLYFYDENVVDMAKLIKPSLRGELEISTLNNMYLENGTLKVELLDKEFSWFDTGTHNSLFEASKLVYTIEKQQKAKIACLEEIAFYNGWITTDEILSYGNEMNKTEYGQYLIKLINSK